ncbi:hypothetical protein ACW4FP_12535 [Paenarthrobacter ureafaciens]
MPRRKFLPGPPPRSKAGGLRHTRHPEHVELCPECRFAVHRERQYLERLRGAAVPEASPDLTRRLLQQTHLLADQTATADPLVRRTSRRSIRTAGIAAGTLAVSAGALALAAYTVAGDAVYDAGAVRNAGASSMAAMLGGPMERATSDPVPESRRILAPSELDSLRSQGWACPELSGMGFQVVSAEVTRHNGHPAVEIRLENGTHHATVMEEHLPVPNASPAAGATSAQLSLSQGNPWKAVYRTSAAVLSYSSDLPAEKADDAVPELVRAADSMAHQAASGTSETWLERLLRGLRTLIHPAGL